MSLCFRVCTSAVWVLAVSGSAIVLLSREHGHVYLLACACRNAHVL